VPVTKKKVLLNIDARSMEVEVEVTTQEEVQTLKYDLVKMGIDFVPWPGNAVSVSFINIE
jgi:hypothetical protein